MVDNLVNSNRKSLEVVERITGVEVPFYEADIRDTDTLRDIFKQEEPTGVIHFAGLKAVGESTVFLLPTMTTILLGLLVF